MSGLPQLSVSLCLRTSNSSSSSEGVERSSKVNNIVVDVTHDVKGPVRDWIPLCVDSEIVLRVDLRRLNRSDKVSVCCTVCNYFDFYYFFLLLIN